MIQNSFTEKFSPILWEPGHMGAFLGRLLNDASIKNKLAICPFIRNMWDITPQGEWFFHERINGVLSQDISVFNEIAEQLQYTDHNDLLVKLMKFQYIRSQEFFEGSNCDTRLALSLTPSETIMPILDKIDGLKITDNITFPYIKSHVRVQDLELLNQFPWRKKIFCLLPKDKEWISQIFIFYKHFYFFAQDPDFDINKDQPYTSFFSEFGKNFVNIVETNFDIYSKSTIEYYYKTIREPEYHIVDIYDIVFNKNYKELERCTGEPCSQSQMDLIELMHKRSNDILAHFQLDHNYCHKTSNGEYFMTDKIQEIYRDIKSRLK